MARDHFERSSLTRRRFLFATGAFAAAGFAGYSSVTTAFGATTDAGRLTISAGSFTGTASVGLQELGGRNGLLYIPPSYRANEPLPLLILLHKSQGTPASWFSGGHPNARDSYSKYADSGQFIILAPAAAGDTWDGGPKTWGRDFVLINSALEAAFARCAIDRRRLAIGGFSDGASYALSLGLANGDLFSNVIAFSPGYIVRSIGRGRPSVFISHGTVDKVLPIDECSRPFVAGLRKNGYTVTFQEFGGRHEIPPAISDQAMAWLKASFDRRT